MNILVINSGSSSLKSSLYRLIEEQLPPSPAPPIWSGEVSWNSTGISVLRVKTADNKSMQEKRSVGDFSVDRLRQQGFQDLLQLLWQGETQVIQDIHDIDIVGHRVVHGGDKYRQPLIINAAVRAEIDRLSVFAPLHNPASLMGIETLGLLSNSLPQMAVFDTAFYGDLPEVAYVYPVPYQWLEQGIRKYGFHGISHQYCVQRAAQLLDRNLAELRIISCHLGNGCSLAAVRGGRCIDTTMGFTPLDGLMMGTRCGSIDPGIVLHLLRTGAYTSAELDRILNSESGLLGVSGLSNDLREIDRAIALGNERAKLALALYIDRLAAKIAAFLPNLEGMDALIFTAGVGENHGGVRMAVANKLAFLGVAIDPELNSLSLVADHDIATAASSARLLVIHTQEEWQIARICWQYLQSSGQSVSSIDQ